jgi:hypothetical protein
VSAIESAVCVHNRGPIWSGWCIDREKTDAVLDKGLVLIPAGGVAGVTQDDKQNNCDLTRPGQSTVRRVK